tara:strand:- start:18020 stop:18682 length:663 start_codon:yes stop_codon:yes gene_type:complete
MADSPINLTTENLFDIMYTMRAMRRLKPDPVPDELVVKILNAAIRAPSGGNNQPWHFVVVKDIAMKKAVQVWYKKALDEIIGPRYATSAPPPGSDAAKYHRQHLAVEYLTEHFHEAPVWIVCCLKSGDGLPSRMAGASIYPAVQNILLACRALGLGANITTRHLIYADETERALELPKDYLSYAIIPVGYPMGNFGPVTRGDLRDFVSLDRIGQRWDALD